MSTLDGGREGAGCCGGGVGGDGHGSVVDRSAVQAAYEAMRMEGWWVVRQVRRTLRDAGLADASGVWARCVAGPLLRMEEVWDEFEGLVSRAEQLVEQARGDSGGRE